MAAAARLGQLKVRWHCLQADVALAVHSVDCTARDMSYINSYSHETPQIEVCEVRFVSSGCSSRTARCLREVNLAVVDKVTGRV